MSAPSPALDDASPRPWPDLKLFGVPRCHPFTSRRSFDYEQKYPSDSSGKEASPEARVWLVYLDEAEMYDHDMIQGFRETIDSLLVLAGLFSAIVATFVAQTKQALKPDFAQLNLLVQLEQIALLRTGGNISAMRTVPISNITTDTPTYTTADLWINGLFFTSLSLSAYTSVTSGSARDKVLTRQFRFDGLIKWNVPEIVGSRPSFTWHPRSSSPACLALLILVISCLIVKGRPSRTPQIQSEVTALPDVSRSNTLSAPPPPYPGDTENNPALCGYPIPTVPALACDPSTPGNDGGHSDHHHDGRPDAEPASGQTGSGTTRGEPDSSGGISSTGGVTGGDSGGGASTGGDGNGGTS
ncbi:hypothetical protein DL96DRAFT_1820558 [Flagelloscypha sp. PMI_526]|nr:hypothetical protein DL96DRAFT_1820558 [Flagelloscypha sp. PMI_526]